MAAKPERAFSNQTAYERFEALTKKLLAVPKKEVDDKEAKRPKRERKPKEA